MGKDISSFYVCHGAAAIIGSETILIPLYHHPVFLVRNPVCYEARGRARNPYYSCFPREGASTRVTLLAFPLSILVCPQGEGATYLFGASTMEGVGHSYFSLREHTAPSLLSHDSVGSRP